MPRIISKNERNTKNLARRLIIGVFFLLFPNAALATPSFIPPPTFSFTPLFIAAVIIYLYIRLMPWRRWLKFGVLFSGTLFILLLVDPAGSGIALLYIYIIMAAPFEAPLSWIYNLILMNTIPLPFAIFMLPLYLVAFATGALAGILIQKYKHKLPAKPSTLNRKAVIISPLPIALMIWIITVIQLVLGEWYEPQQYIKYLLPWIFMGISALVLLQFGVKTWRAVTANRIEHLIVVAMVLFVVYQIIQQLAFSISWNLSSGYSLWYTVIFRNALLGYPAILGFPGYPGDTQFSFFAFAFLITFTLLGGAIARYMDIRKHLSHEKILNQK